MMVGKASEMVIISASHNIIYLNYFNRDYNAKVLSLRMTLKIKEPLMLVNQETKWPQNSVLFNTVYFSK